MRRIPRHPSGGKIRWALASLRSGPRRSVCGQSPRDEISTGEVRTIGRVEAQESRRFLVSAGTDGWIRRIYSGESGSTVAKGQPLASYYSRDIASPQQAYLYAVDAQQRLGATATAAQQDLAGRQV